MKYRHVFSLVLVFALLFLAVDLMAQCPMCRMSAESNLQHGGTTGKGLNTGILYMLAMPYLFVLLLGYIWWRNRRHETEEELISS